MTLDALLAWALPLRGLRWRGFRRNRRQVYRRVQARITELGLDGAAAYRAYLDEHADEGTVLEALCRVTISRFARDGEMWTVLVRDVLPRLGAVRAWSAGCGAGEEPFTLAMAWPGAEVIATDIDDVQLARAATGVFPVSALRELPEAWRAAGIVDARVRDEVRARVVFEHRDLRAAPPAGSFTLVLCRNLAYSYFDEATQRAVTATFHRVLRPGGVLVVGGDEVLPEGSDFTPLSPGIYQRRETQRPIEPAGS